MTNKPDKPNRPAREVIAEAIDRIDHGSRAPEGYANDIENEWVSDWGAWLADGVLIALAEAGYDVVYDPLNAVKDFKTWPRDVRRFLGVRVDD